MVVACGNNNPATAVGDDSRFMAGATDPVPARNYLIGTWSYAGRSFSAKMTANVTDHLIGQGVADTAAAAIAGQVVDAASIVDLPSITFNENGTLTVDVPSGPTSGTWSAVVDTLTITIDGEEYPPFTYTIRSGQSISLQLSISAQVVRELIEASGAVDQVLVDVMFRGIAQLTFGYNRTKQVS